VELFISEFRSQELRHIRLLTESRASRFLDLVTVKAALENNLSAGTDVAGVAREKCRHFIHSVGSTT